MWRGPLILKGILHPDEAREAVKRGADGIIVSNHGGRQLDGAVASIRALPGIVEAVGGRAPVLVDGGFRRGIDVVKALALGARAVLIGRPHLWGVACAGEDGVFWVLELFRREIDRALALGGWDGVAKLNPGVFFDAARRAPETAQARAARSRAFPTGTRGRRPDRPPHIWGLVIARQSAATSRHDRRRDDASGPSDRDRVRRGPGDRCAGDAQNRSRAFVAARGSQETRPEDQPQRVSAAGQSRLLEYAAEALDDSALGLHLAEQADPRDAGILFYITAGAKDVNEAVALFVRYCRIVNEATRVKLARTSEGVAIEFHVVGVPRHSARQNLEFGLAVYLKGLREITGRHVRPIRAAFAHARNSRLREFERFFGCPVEFGRASSEGASSDLLEFSGEILALPLVNADPKLVEALRPFCDAAARERSTASGTLRAAVEGELEKLLPNGKAQRHRIAQQARFEHPNAVAQARQRGHDLRRRR